MRTLPSGARRTMCSVRKRHCASLCGPKGVATTQEEFEAKLGYQTGTVHLSGGMATITLPEEFRFLDVEGAKRLLVDAWGNPERSAEGVLGMMVPADVSPLEPGGWGIVITYDNDGFVNDDDAARMDFDKLLGEMQAGAREVNEEREKEGQPAVDLVGWAEPPHYDAEAHKLYWAKELAFGAELEQVSSGVVVARVRPIEDAAIR